MQKDLFFEIKLKVEYHGILKNNKQIRLNRKIGNRFIASSSRAELAADYLLYEFRKHVNFRPITRKGPVHFECIFYFKNFFVKSGANKGQLSSKVADLSNLYELPQDVLQKAEIIQDDRQIVMHDGSRRKPSDNGDNYIHLKLYELHQFEH